VGSRALVRVCWHGGPSFSLDLAGTVVLVDPAFSKPGDYPPWFDDKCVNPHAPTVEEFLTVHRPDYVFITHGHFDHFDLRTVERLAAALRAPIVGSEAVVRTCREVLGLDEERLLACPEPRDSLDRAFEAPAAPAAEASRLWEDLAPGVRFRPVPGAHWFTGPEGDRVAAKLAGRPERYGVMPCGGPMLGFVFAVDTPRGGRELTVYVSGDTEFGSFPEGPFDAAVVSCGGMLMNPSTRRVEGPFLDEAHLARAASETLKAGVLVPVHYDHPVFLTPFDIEKLRAELRTYPRAPRLLVPTYGNWETLLA